MNPQPLTSSQLHDQCGEKAGHIRGGAATKKVGVVAHQAEDEVDNADVDETITVSQPALAGDGSRTQSMEDSYTKVTSSLSDTLKEEEEDDLSTVSLTELSPNSTLVQVQDSSAQETRVGWEKQGEGARKAEERREKTEQTKLSGEAQLPLEDDHSSSDTPPVIQQAVHTHPLAASSGANVGAESKQEAAAASGALYSKEDIREMVRTELEPIIQVLERVGEGETRE